ncbi:MAG: hypothetical protein KKA84_09230 [Bacteroidetes bacterium]|nr:hypothetical protein [Bacteroidota bacterium]
MKNIIIVFVFVVCSTLSAQEKTLFPSEDYSSGWYGASVLKLAEINNQSSLLMGVQAGYIMNHSFIIGLVMNGLVSNLGIEPQTGDVLSDNKDYLHLMYGGVELGYVILPMEQFHLVLSSLIGFGKIGYNNSVDDGNNDNFMGSHNGVSFFLVEPTVSVEANITSFFKVKAGVNYRFSTGVEYRDLRNEDVSGLSGELNFKFGSF